MKVYNFRLKRDFGMVRFTIPVPRSLARNEELEIVLDDKAAKSLAVGLLNTLQEVVVPWDAVFDAIVRKLGRAQEVNEVLEQIENVTVDWMKK